MSHDRDFGSRFQSTVLRPTRQKNKYIYIIIMQITQYYTKTTGENEERICKMEPESRFSLLDSWRVSVLEISGRPVVRDDQKIYRATNFGEN